MADRDFRIELGNYSITRSNDGYVVVDFVPVRSPDGTVRVGAVWKMSLDEIIALTTALHSLSAQTPTSTARN